MASALAPLQNATVVFTVPASGGSTVTDATTGNVTPATATVTVKCYLKGEAGGTTRYPGVDVADAEYTGYAVSPQVIDARVTVGTEGVLTWDRGTWDVEVLGVRERYGATGLIGATLRSVIGDSVRMVARGQR